jgi:3-oxoacyl-[acyl-carrier protein] reductase
VDSASSDFDRFAVGQSASLERVISAEDVSAFSRLTGDDNPVHVDDEYARQMGLGGRVVHGMLTAGFISTLIGTALPGPGALWLSERFNFRAPTRIGDRVQATVVVRRISPSTRVLVLDVEVRNQRAALLLDGEAHVHVLKPPDDADRIEHVVKSVVVTGSGRGIGAVIAKRLAADGANVVINYLQDEHRARKIQREISDAGGEATLFKADVSDPEQAAALIAHAIATHGQLDAVVNNAGGGPHPQPLVETTWEDLERHLASHLRAGFLCTQAALPGMIERRFGRIVNVTSQSAYGMPPSKMAGYVTAKAALAAFTRCVAIETGPFGVTANAVAPGMADTEMVAEVSQRAKAVLASQTPLRRLARTEDVAATVAYLLSPSAAYLTGQTLHLSGGQVMG